MIPGFTSVVNEIEITMIGDGCHPLKPILIIPCDTMRLMHNRKVSRTVVPLLLIVIGIAGASRFMANVRTADAVGLFACGALVGVSVMRLLLALRSRR